MSRISTDDLRRAGLRVVDGSVVPIANRKTVGEPARSILPALPRKESALEARFVELWAECNGPELKREVHLIPGRMFRVDFLHEATKTVIEIQGFRDHTSRKGFARDNEKFFLLFKLRFQVITLDRKLINEENVSSIIRRLTTQTIGL